MTRLILAAAALVLVGAGTPAQADPITYTISSAVSGTLGGTPFTDALVTVTLTGDTADITPGPAPYTDVVVNAGNATVDVSGIGIATFTDSVVIVDTLSDTTIFGVPAVLFLDYTTGTGIMLQTGSVFTTYDLGSSLGPITGTGGVASGSAITPVFPTTDGDLTWEIGQPSGTSTFTAVVTTPEPGSFVLLCVAVLALVLSRRFMQRA